MQGQELVLRDVHVPVAPSLWPPAPGWWLLAAAVLTVVALLWLLQLRRQRRLQARQRLFDDACHGLPAAAQVAALLVHLPVQFDELFGKVQEAADIGDGQALDSQQMPVPEDKTRFRCSCH